VAIREESYAEFSSRLHDKCANARVPVNIDYDVTYRCNLNCRHCYCNLPADDQVARTAELSASRAGDILEQARALGVLWILFTGGEPLLKPDFKDIYLIARGLGLLPTVFTNGVLMDEEWGDFFSEHRPFKLEITLHSMESEVYESVTRAPGSYNRCMNGIRLLVARKVPLVLKTVVTRTNRCALADVRGFAAELGCSFRYDFLIHARYSDLPREGQPDPRDERIGVDDALAADRQDDKRAQGIKNICNRLRGITHRQDKFLTCGAGKTAFNLDPYGMVRPCGMLRGMSFDPFVHSLRDIWDDRLSAVSSMPAARPAECAGCHLGPMCMNCAGWASVETGRYDGWIPYVCEISKTRAEVFAGT